MAYIAPRSVRRRPIIAAPAHLQTQGDWGRVQCSSHSTAGRFGRPCSRTEDRTSQRSPCPRFAATSNLIHWRELRLSGTFGLPSGLRRRFSSTGGHDEMAAEQW